MKIGIAAAFRHDPVDDGKTIPASRGVEVDYHGYDYYVLPIIGYIAYTVDGKTVNWSFMKYEVSIAFRLTDGFGHQLHNYGTKFNSVSIAFRLTEGFGL